MLQLLYRIIALQDLIWLIVALPLMGAAINGMVALATARGDTARFKPLVSFVGCLCPLLSLAAAVVLFFTLTGFEAGPPAVITGPLFRWIAGAGLVVEVGLKVDQLSLIMVLVVAGVGSLIHFSSIGSLAHDAGYARYFSKTNLLLFFMLLLVLADNLLLLFIGWEGVALCSSLLIGYWFEDGAKARAGLKAFLFNRVGDAGFLAALFLIYGVMSAAGAAPEAGYFNFETMQRYGGYFIPVATILSLLLFAGVAGKSAQLPLHVWLPDAVDCPMPAAALMQSATMVAAGVYLVARLNFIFILSPTALQTIATFGAATALIAASMGLVVTDLRKILAYSTISQLGVMFVAIGVGAFAVAILHLVAHAFFKALLILCAGSVIQALGGEGDVRRMGGLGRRMPLTAWTFVIAAAALAGIPPTIGFFSINAILWQAYERGQVALWAMGFIGVGLMAFSIFRAAGLVFFGETNVPLERLKRVTEAPVSMALPMMMLATLTVVGGILGVPAILHGGSRLVSWLGTLVSYEIGHAPAEGSSIEIILMVVTLLWSAHFSVLGWLIYAQKREWPRRVARRVAPLHAVVANLYFVDQLYRWLILRPLVWVSRCLLWQTVDRVFIDGLVVQGTARVVGFAALVVGATQTGALQRYLLYFLVGAAAVIGFFAF